MSENNIYPDLKINGRLFPLWIIKNFKKYKLNLIIKKEEEDFVRENMDVTFSDDDSDLNNLIRFPGPKPDRVH